MRYCLRPSLVLLLLVGAVIHGCVFASNDAAKISAVTLQEQSHKDRGIRVDTNRASLLETKVDRYLMPYLNTGNFSGSILIAQKGEVLLSKGYGYSNLEQRVPNAPNTVFHLASVSRIFTSAAILLLEQQGKLSVKDKLSKYLPDWPRGDEIMIHHLLTLSAGFPNINSLPGYKTWSKSHQTPTTLCEKFRDLPLEFLPGTKSIHSNSNYNVLALLIEKLSKKTYGEFLAEELFIPLGMTQTAHDDYANRTVPHEAQGYMPTGLANMRKMDTPDWSVKTGNGSIYSTTNDLYKFDRMLVEKTLLNETSITKIFTEHYPLNGYGWFVRDHNRKKLLSINGRSPGFGCSWVRSVGADVTVIVLGNLYSGVPSEISRNLVKMIMGEEVESVRISRDPPDPLLLADVVGSYKFGSDFYVPNGTVSIHVEDGHLFDNRSFWLIPAGGMKFVNRIYWSDLEFLRDESGKVVELRYDNYTGVRED